MPEITTDLSEWAVQMVELYTSCAVGKNLCKRDIMKRN